MKSLILVVGFAQKICNTAKGHFLVCVFYLVLLLQSIHTIAELCKAPLYNSYHPNSKLEGHVIKTFTPVPTKEDCTDACSFNNDCHSINFYNNNKTCELNNHNHLTKPASLIRAPGGEYIDYYQRPPRVCTADTAVGMEDGRITNAQLTASSAYLGSIGRIEAWHARLYRKVDKPAGVYGGWSARFPDAHQWIKVDLSKTTSIVAIATQGLEYANQWVKTYTIQYSNDGITFTGYNGGQVFSGNTDSNTVVKNPLLVTARFIRIRPKSWNYWIALRFELYYCH